MRTLQNNFTTPEQSERLLELGVPADSADCYYDKDEVDIDEVVQPYFVPFNRKFSNYDERFYLPCWSVGRLIEIWHKTNRQQCSVPLSLIITHYRGADTIIEYLDKLHKEGVDFSKLEE